MHIKTSTECNKCGGEMYQEDRVDNTRIADISTKCYNVCEDCGHEYVTSNQ